MEQILFPKVLFGTHREVRAAWSGIVKRAVKQGGWGDILSSLEMTPIDDVPGDVIVYWTRRNLTPNTLKWCGFVVGETLPMVGKALKTPWFEDVAASVARRLIVEAMQYAWFTISIIQIEDVHVPRDTSDDPRDSVRFELLQWYVHWVAEIAHVEDRFGTGCVPASEWRQIFPHGWIWQINRYANLAGLEVDSGDQLELTKQIDTQYRGDCAAYLVGVGIAERHNGRCRLRISRASGEKWQG